MVCRWVSYSDKHPRQDAEALSSLRHPGYAGKPAQTILGLGVQCYRIEPYMDVLAASWLNRIPSGKPKKRDEEKQQQHHPSPSKSPPTKPTSQTAYNKPSPPRLLHTTHPTPHTNP